MAEVIWHDAPDEFPNSTDLRVLINVAVTTEHFLLIVRSRRRIIKSMLKFLRLECFYPLCSCYKHKTIPSPRLREPIRTFKAKTNGPVPWILLINYSRKQSRRRCAERAETEAGAGSFPNGTWPLRLAFDSPQKWKTKSGSRICPSPHTCPRGGRENVKQQPRRYITFRVKIGKPAASVQEAALPETWSCLKCLTWVSRRSNAV